MSIQRVGDAPKRREDARFTTGDGQYLDDLRFDGLTHAVFVRSPHAHANIRSVDIAAASALPGVLTVLTAADAATDGLKDLPPYALSNTKTEEAFACDDQPLLASARVRFVGETIAIVVAETKAQAQDAAEAVIVDYDALDAVIEGRGALAPGAPQVSDAVPGNLCMDWLEGDVDAANKAFAEAAHVAEVSLFNHRIVTNPMEPRGGVGVYDPDAGRYTLRVSSQNIHINRDFIAETLGASRDDVRWLAPDVGGGFGAKNFAYVEQALLLWAAKRTGRPVKWIASRSEVFLTDHQSRDHDAVARLALDAEGHFLGLEIDSIANLGAYMVGSAGGVHTFQYAHLPGTIYVIPAIALRVRTALSHTTPIGVTRGPGFAEMVNIVERLIDEAATVTGISRLDLRRRNFVQPSAMPRTNPLGNTVDSGDFPAALEQAITRADASSFETRRAASSKRLGLGVACHIKATGGSPHENVEIKFRDDGGVDLITG
ncbi:MAG: xanthine dehydrogenase family protein molybdopterin-binding subunit, partial [Alphaproteobacteria bacterium]